MSGNLSSWAIRRPVPPLVLFVLLTVLGWAGWHRLPVQSMPAISIPLVQVALAQEGASAEDLERQVVRPLEAAIASSAGLKRLTSTISVGSATILCEFRLEVPLDRAAILVRDAVDRVRPTLPAALRDPTIERFDSNGGTLRTWTLAGSARTPRELSAFVDETVLPALQAVPGIATARREGGVQREIHIELSRDALLVQGLSIDAIEALARAALVDQPAGIHAAPAGERLLRVAAIGRGSLDALASLRVPLPRGGSARLDEVATLRDATAEPTAIARLDGAEVVGFSIERAQGASETVVAEAADAVLARIRAAHPWVAIDLRTDQVAATRESFEGAISALVEGAVLAVLVVGIFLRNWRATAIAAVAIPLSMIPTFAVMSLLGFSLNGVSLLAISLVAGVLVDDAIVEIENIVRHQRLGLSPYRAALVASEHIGLAVVATSLVIVAVFVPVSFMPGIIGRFFVEFGLTIAVAVLMSLLVARLLTPLFAAYLLRNPGRHSDGRPGRMGRTYRTLVIACLRHPVLTLAVAAILLVASLALTPLLPTGFSSASDRGISTLRVRLPAGTSLAEADRRIGEVTALIRAQPEVASVFASSAIPDGVISTTLRADRSGSTARWEEQLRPKLADIPDIQTAFLTESGTRALTLELRGDDPVVLVEARERLAAAMRALPQLHAVTAGETRRNETIFTARQAETAALRVDGATVARTLKLATLGDDPQNLPQAPSGSQLVPVRLSAERSLREDTAALLALRVQLPDGGTTPLAVLGDLRYGDGPATIKRTDRQRSVVIEADLAAGTTLGQALAAVQKLPEWSGLPTGVHPAPQGDAELIGELFSGFAAAAGFGLLAMYLLLVLLYRDILQPLTIIGTLPLAIGGAIVGLVLSASMLELAALIGLLTLLGIVAKNAILVVDETIQRLGRGETPGRAALAAASTRSRPVVMTSLAMIAGMLPIVLGTAPDASFRAPMAWAVIGGLTSSTLLSLVVVPAAFLIVHRVAGRLGRLGARLVRLPDDDDRRPSAE
jgi:multidrug efflux pump subunit AcrB